MLTASVFLFITTLLSFLFYGVAGKDKTWLLAPLFTLNYGMISTWMWKRVWKSSFSRTSPKQNKAVRMPIGNQLNDLRLPISGSLWILFLFYSLFLIPRAVVPFESKLVTLFVSSVIGAYFVWGEELKTFKDNRIFLGILIFVVMISAFYGLVVHVKCPDQILWAERYAIYEGRLASTYICPNHFAHLMQMLLPFCLSLLCIPQSGLYLRILGGYSFLLFLPTLFLTESRAAWLGSIVSVVVTCCLMALRRNRKLFLVLLILIPVCTFFLLLAGWRYSETFQQRAKPVVGFLQQQKTEGIGSESYDFRPQTWMDTMTMIKDAPLFGFGPGGYRYIFPEYRERFRGKRVVTGHPHNEYLELIADYGLIGFGLFVAAWLYGCIWILVKSLKTKELRHAYMAFSLLGVAAGTMVHSFFDFQMHVYPNALVFALLTALTMGPLRREISPKRETAAGRRNDRKKQPEMTRDDLYAPNN